MSSRRYPLLGLLLTLVVCVSLVVGCASTATPTAAPAAPTSAPASAPTTAPAAAPTTASDPAVQPIILKGDMVHTETHPASKAITPTLKLIEERSKGRLKFDITYGGSLVSASEEVTIVGRGTVDWSHAYPGFVSGKDPRFEISSLPFAFTSPANAFEAMRTTSLGELLEAAANKFGATFIGYVDGGTFRIMSKKPVATLEDIKGQKIRVSAASWTEAMKRMGVVPVSVVTEEIYPAVEKGVVDGVLLPFYTLNAYKLSEQIKYINEIPVVSGNFQGIYITKKKFDSLPKDLQALIRDTFQERERATMELQQQEEAKARETAKAAGITIIPLNETEQQRWRAAGGLPVWEWIAERMTKEDAAVFLDALTKWTGMN